VTALADWPYDQPRPPVLLVHSNPTRSFYYRSLLAALPPLGLQTIAAR